MKNNNRIFLIYPEMDKASLFKMNRPLLPPLGLSFLAGYLNKNGYEVRIIDNTVDNKTHNDIALFINQWNPLLIGIQCLSVNFQSCLALTQIIKKVSNFPIVIGGPHATVMSETLQKPYIDFVCVGEGEETLLSLAISLKNETNENIPGLWRNQNGWVFGGDRKWIANLDVIPHPARHLLTGSYTNRVAELSAYPVLAVNSSRGCPFACTFCSVESMWGRQYRSFSVDWILEELNILKKMNVQGIYFYEDNFTFSAKRVMEICQGIQNKNYKFEWACEGRIGSVPLELLKEMKKAGCRLIKFGIESGSPKILELMNKRINIDETIKTRELCKMAGIAFACFFMIGFPGETEEDRGLTLNFIRKLKPDQLVIGSFIPIPKSKTYQDLLITHDYDHIDSNCMIHYQKDRAALLQNWLARINRVWEEIKA